MPKKSKPVPFLSNNVSFSEAYPDIEEFEMWIEVKDLTGKVRGTHHFSKGSENPPAHVDCGNPQCREGGWNISEIINPLYHDKVHEKEDSLACRGYEKIGFAKNATRSCCTIARYKVKIKYKQSKGQSEG